MAVVRIETQPPLVKIDSSSVQDFPSDLPASITRPGVIYNLPAGVTTRVDTSSINELFERAPLYSYSPDATSTFDIVLIGLGSLRPHTYTERGGVEYPKDMVSAPFEYSFVYTPATLPLYTIGSLLQLNEKFSFGSSDAFPVNSGVSFANSDVTIEFFTALSYATSEAPAALEALAPEFGESDLPADIVDPNLVYADSDIEEFATEALMAFMAQNDVEFEKFIGRRYSLSDVPALATTLISFAQNDISPSGFNRVFSQSDVALIGQPGSSFAQSNTAGFVTSAFNFAVNIVKPVSSSIQMATSDIGDIFSGNTSYVESGAVAVNFKLSMAASDAFIPRQILNVANSATSSALIGSSGIQFAQNEAAVTDEPFLTPMVRNEVYIGVSGAVSIVTTDTSGRFFDSGVLVDPLFNEYVAGF